MTDQKIPTNPLENNAKIEHKVNLNRQIFDKYCNRVFTFKPKTVQIKEFNPLLQPYLSVPSLFMSLMLARLYRHKYFLIKASTIRLFSAGLNYSILYYLLINGVELYNHLNSDEESPINA